MRGLMTRVLFVVALATLVAAPASAQLAQGRLTGTVTDAQGAVLPGVAVTASSPTLIGTQVVVTEADGVYRFPALPPGTYTLVFELSGFQTLRREGIVLALGQILTVNAQLQLATLAETITVTGESPVVDLESTKIGSEFSAEKLVGVPTATDIWSALSQAPGVRMRGFDVGGSHKSQQVPYESWGIRGQNRVVTEGVDTTEGASAAGIYQDFFAHEEITVSAAGADVMMYAPGSAVVSSIKSGGNTFKGIENITYEGESFVGRNVDAENAARGDTGQPNLIFWEGHADLGGPVKRDKAWFYGAYNHFKIDKVISGVNPGIATDLGLFDNFTGKGTYRATDKDTIVAYYQWGRKQKPNRGLSVTVPPESILAQDSKSWMYNAQWQRVWTNRLFSDVKVGRFGFTWPMEPAVDFRSNLPRIDLDTGVQSGSGFGVGPFTFDRNKPQVTVVGTYYLPNAAGSHDFKFGYEYLNDQSKFGLNGRSGPIQYRDRSGRVAEIDLWDFGDPGTFGDAWLGADDRNMRHALFLQDRWSPTNRLTVTVGVRYDRQRPHYQPSKRRPVLTDLFSNLDTEGRTLLTSNKAMPRAGFSYDVIGDGRSVVKAYYGRFYFNFADDLSPANPGGANRQRYVFLDPNGNRLYDGAHELGTLILQTGGTSTQVDPDIKTPHADEFNVSFERQFWGESSFRVAYVRKQVRDEFATFNPNRLGQFTIPRTVTVTLQSFGVNGPVNEGQRTFTLFDIPPGLPTTNIITTIPAEANSNYDTIQVGFTKRFAGGLFVQSSFDYQWRDELRNPNSASTSPLVADPIASSFYLENQAFPDVPNRQENTNWSFRLLGRYVFPYDVGFGANLRVQSGWPYARRITARLPNAGNVRFFVEPIENNRSDTVPIVDFRVDKAFRLADRFRITLMADLFNVLNSNAVTNFNLLNGSQFNRIIAPLDPRTAMVGARLDF